MKYQWKTKSGNKIKPSGMDDGHLKNAYKYSKKRVEQESLEPYQREYFLYFVREFEKEMLNRDMEFKGRFYSGKSNKRRVKDFNF